MIELEINGCAVQAPEGSNVIEAAKAAGVYIPHFCYHKKLSIAANCRMCLVQVEKAPKPLPACATPVTNGMKVFTHSDLAVKAQKGVMEFLLINHPLDCPICDQGGECDLQDLAMGYGASTSRYQEEKRVVVNKNLGALVCTDMTRCINCTRCVRFTQEIAGFMELGQAFRGDRAEIMPFLGQTVDSELSGNIIDLCPVGALTSKPFRFVARAWELARRPSVAPHDSLGSSIEVHSMRGKVLRVVPRENEAINECWLSDRDRFGYEGLNAPDRLTRPMIKQDGQWQEVDWNIALDYAAHALRDIANKSGGNSLGALIAPQATLEEMTLTARLMRGLGCENIDHRLRQRDFSLDGKRLGVPWLGMRIDEIQNLDRVLLVGSFLREEQPLLAQRLRQAGKQGTRVSLVHVRNDDLLLPTSARGSQLIVAPDALPQALAAVLKSVCAKKAVGVPSPWVKACAQITPDAAAQAIADDLISGTQTALFLGAYAQQHHAAGQLHALAQALAEVLGAHLGILLDGANAAGAAIAGALPGPQGLHAQAMLTQPRNAYLLVGTEPEFDCVDSPTALAALTAAASVIVLSPYKSQAALTYADCLLPIAPPTETSGTLINLEGRVQRFAAAVPPLAQTRPGWKVLCALGSVLSLPDGQFESSEAIASQLLAGAVDAALPEFISRRDNRVREITEAETLPVASGVMQRIADVPAYAGDAVLRRATSLQKTQIAQAAAFAHMNTATLMQYGIAVGKAVRCRSGAGTVVLPAAVDDRLPDHSVRIALAHPATCALGVATQITVEKADA